ncbi:unnamed protein product [Peniophora sp. CBMAI 1063]|nr:unnamed protein product [Peniophora sp. CBMAI 1063]
MSAHMHAASDIRWFTCLGRVRPLREGDFDSTQERGVPLHSTRADYIIGRGNAYVDVQIQVDSRRRLAGSQHAVISWDAAANTVIIKDQSLNGTWVNGVKLAVHGTAVLADNAVVWLGPPYHDESCGLVFENAFDRNPVLRKFRPEFLLGAGAYGAVYQMSLRQDQNRVYAVKVIHYDCDEDEDAYTQQHALREVKALFSANGHPNICSIEEHFILPERRSIFVVLPRLPTDLKSRYTHTPPSSSDAQTILKQLLSALKHLEKLLLVHRDIKPENIFILTSSPLCVVVGDFGLVYQIDLPYDDVQANYFRCGTPYYMAPELDLDTPMKYLNKVDCFSVGMTIIHLLIGLRRNPYNIPFKDRTRSHERTWYGHRAVRWELLDSTDLPSAGRQVLRGLSEPDPDRRWDVERALRCRWVAEALDYSGRAVQVCKTVPYVDLTENVSDVTPAVLMEEKGPASRRRSPRLLGKLDVKKTVHQTSRQKREEKVKAARISRGRVGMLRKKRMPANV